MGGLIGGQILLADRARRFEVANHGSVIGLQSLDQAVMFHHIEPGNPMQNGCSAARRLTWPTG
ncbi:hypothetical protein [Mesorhizobium sp. WSM3626]|uniref:hypothetical protein n=1 Tax=Mesorhizobium sp. WSM3626 TaxID=1040987 RepID=UPI0004AEC6F3|nr:hypothetical protein [Mesorhizobium sp. WSM3626]